MRTLRVLPSAWSSATFTLRVCVSVWTSEQCQLKVALFKKRSFICSLNVERVYIVALWGMNNTWAEQALRGKGWGRMWVCAPHQKPVPRHRFDVPCVCVRTHVCVVNGGGSAWEWRARNERGKEQAVKRLSVFSLVSESWLCSQTGAKRRQKWGSESGEKTLRGHRINWEKGKRWTWRQMSRDSCRINSRIMYMRAKGWAKKRRNGAGGREGGQGNILFPLFLSLRHTLPDVFSYSSDTKHDFAYTKPPIAITSPGNKIKSPPPSSSRPPDYSGQWEREPSALSLHLMYYPAVK